MRCAVIGLGKLGLPLAAVLAEAGNQIVGLDNQPELALKLTSGAFTSPEPELERLLKEQRTRLAFTGDYATAVSGSDLAFIIVPTPSHPTKPRFSLEYVQDALVHLLTALQEQQRRDYDIVVVSTVMPGSCQDFLWPQVLKAIPDAEARHISLFYSPEFIALGSVVKNMRYPDMILVGAQNMHRGYELAGFLQEAALNGPKAFCVSWASAELAKLGVNSYLGFKLTAANLLGRLADQLPGADIDKVTEIMGTDSRIGGKFLRAGMSFGGPCLPRDVRALEACLNDYRVPCKPVSAISQYNTDLIQMLAADISREAGHNQPVGMLGFAYKGNTPVTEDSPAKLLAEQLTNRGHKVHVFDASIEATQGQREYRTLAWHSSPAYVLKHCNTLVLPKLSEIELQGVTLEAWRGTVFDLWRQRPQWAAYPGVKLLSQGIGPPVRSNLDIKEALERVGTPETPPRAANPRAQQRAEAHPASA